MNAWEQKSDERWRAVQKQLLAIINQAKPDKQFHWQGKGYYSVVFGFRINYETPRDFTAAVWEVWMAHPRGDTPHFHLQDVIQAAGDLWDRQLMPDIIKELATHNP